MCGCADFGCADGVNSSWKTKVLRWNELRKIGHEQEAEPRPML